MGRSDSGPPVCTGLGLPECHDCRRHVRLVHPWQDTVQREPIDGRCIDYLPPASRPRLNGHLVAMQERQT